MRRPRPGLLIGGSPLRIVRLTAAGIRILDELAAGRPVPPTPGAQRLARRLVDTGMAHPQWASPPSSPAPTVTVVVPVRDRPVGLVATLQALTVPGSTAGPTGGPTTPGPTVVVVDDASADPAATEAAASRFPDTRVLQRGVRGGPAAARQSGWQSADGEIVAFVDADCEPAAGWIEALLPHFADPTVGAVAPRVVPASTTTASPASSAGTGTAVATYEHYRSPLDLGDRPALVRPRSRVPYVPTAALLVRRSALAEVGGFDPALLVGEDVDLVWRLDRAGWRVRYVPAVVVAHPVRPTFCGLVRQRYSYGTSAAQLATRHGRAAAPLDVSPWSAAAWGLAGAGQPLAGLVVAAASTAGWLRPTVTGAGSLPVGPAARLALAGQWRAGWAAAEAVRRSWWPLAAAVALASRRTRPALLAAILGPPMIDWVRRRPALGPLRWTALYLVDDLSYGAGLWAGAIAARSADALRPRWR